MKLTKTKILCLLLAGLMLFSLTACGKNKNPDLIKLGEYELHYKGACIMEDSDGNDAIVLKLDFTNNSKESASYLWSVSETAVQNGAELEVATVYTDYNTYASTVDNQFEAVEPGATLEIQTAFVLNDATNKVEVSFEQIFGKKNGKITVEPSELSRVEATGAATSGSELTTTSASSGDALLDWWNGEWYGWWKMTGCSGYYENMEGKWWDVCGVIDVGADHLGTVTLWDEDYTKAEPMASASVSLSEAGTGEHGTMMSEGGWFTDVALEHADWIVDPGLLDYDDTIWIDGDYENGDDEFHYDIYLRPWGSYWDDMEEQARPHLYADWYLPMIDAGKSMPDSIGADAPAVSGNAGAVTAEPSGNASGDGIVSEEKLQKGYIWMSKVAKDIFNTPYDGVVAYFGTEGKFEKEEYSDHMGANYCYYKWISEENDSHFIYVNFKESEDKPGVYNVSGFNSSGFSAQEAYDKYFDIVKAEANEQDKAASANAAMKQFSVEVAQFAKKDVTVKITTSIPESGWSYNESKKTLVDNADPDAFGAGGMRFEVRGAVEDFDFYKKDFENYQQIEDRVIGGITFSGRTYKYIGYEWIEYVAQIDSTRALSIGLQNMDCAPGMMSDIILNNMQFK